MSCNAFTYYILLPLFEPVCHKKGQNVSPLWSWHKVSNRRHDLVVTLKQYMALLSPNHLQCPYSTAVAPLSANCPKHFVHIHVTWNLYESKENMISVGKQLSLAAQIKTNLPAVTKHDFCCFVKLKTNMDITPVFDCTPVVIVQWKRVTKE